MARRKKESKRDWQPREQRLVAEFLAKFYPEAEIRTHVHLGSIQPRLRGRYATDAEQRMVGIFRRWADAVILLPDRVILLEGKILPQPGVISQLELYERLLPKTPELEEHVHKPLEKMLLCAIEDPVVTQMAREKNIRVVTFKPAWLDAYLEMLSPSERTPTPGGFEE